jgi:hypothetical protein
MVQIINKTAKILISLIVLILISSGCKAGNEIKELKSTKTYKIKIDNSDTEAIGYKSYEDDMDIGVNSIYKSGSIIYITDPYHKNIKALNINSGDINTSRELFPWITDICVYKDRICVLNEYDGLKILNNKLIISQNINMPKGYKYFIRYQDKMYIINATEFNKSEGKTFYQAFELKPIIENGKLEETNLSFKTLPMKYGYFNEEEELNGKIYLKAEDSYYEIPKKLKQIEGFDAYNIFVDKSEVVYYYLTGKELIIEVFNYQ